ncbi:TIGR04282 family arsenosugar biosynthesis glycosyltransferase [Chloroflexus sp.]|uniref:TIGR04282 family arsenosugar biosynthesis glycosyltransferase n=1 Tax=Chloroflexus sp. TaxID=1904827 RepID=UPI00298EEE07|nr:TIGR04282 family arsenosugar biosynthesis glycosyltransferase [Chloroflexus sp.]MCS6889379.1 TIGR04282 family arsenosugar biosynthesis glycosyltransferase [Chloroflexus sp.]MDW8405898.1 TIGR04282 family arsenosugar biosynthesis glycosyltransferase [Chloroflexus sp.]
MHPCPALVMMARLPAAGRVKTRLCPPLTPAQAATLYAAFLRDLVELLRAVPGVHPIIAYAPDEAADYFAALAPDMARLPQTGADLGERLATVTGAVLGEGAPAVVVIGSDSPSLPPAHIAQALAALEHGVDLVLGPADDGGYYLVGLRRPAPELFTNVTMSTSTVLGDTLAIAEQLGLRTVLIDPWYDIDTIADLVRLQTDPAPLRHTRPLLAELLADH